MRQHTFYEAYLDDFDKIVVYLSCDSYGGQSSFFKLRDEAGNLRDLQIQSIEHTPQNYNRYTLSVSQPLCIGEEYEVVHQHARSAILEYAYIVKTKKFDEMFAYSGHDLGACYTKHSTLFNVWAPTASKVNVEIHQHGRISTYAMERSEFGVFRCEIHGDLEGVSYVYHVRVNGTWRECLDPYGLSSNANSKRSFVIDREKLKSKKEYTLPKMNSYCDAIIYEASVRDFTIASHCGVQKHGTYLGFIEENETTRQKNTGFSYLKSLGITHVQLMPVLDFGSIDELNPSLYYNWGYDPVQYFTPEGSYASDPNNPYARIDELKQLIDTCHASGLRVNLDVVFNHVYDLEHVSLDNIVPYYYFQMNEYGEMSNGSFCGNDLDSRVKMCRKLIIDSCMFLCDVYQIDGLRFDLMGILDVDTMNEIYDTCAALNPDFMVYGEGWDMPSLLDGNLRASLRNNELMQHVAHFSDRFRDVAKGRTATHEAGIKGYVSGDLGMLSIMKNVMMASVNDYGDSRMFSSPLHVVNYVECHDNMTSWDKLKECCKEDVREVRILRHEMLIAAVLLAQGIPFLHSGQEFARTKHQMGNTYEEKDHINQIDYDRRDRYQSIVEHTKALIDIRKRYACLRYDSTEKINKYINFDEIEHQVMIYKIKDEVDDMIIIMNPSGNTWFYDLGSVYHQLYNNAASENIEVQHIVIEPYHTLIYHRPSTQQV